MPNTISIRRRIGSVKNTKQITKAMELVSASKMRRAQERAIRSRSYSELAYSLLARLSSLKEVANDPLFKQRNIKDRLYVVLTSNSGLAGAYNYNVLKQFTLAAQADFAAGVKTQVIMVGRQGANFIRRLQNIELLAVYPAFGDHPTPNNLRPILNTVIDQYRNEKTDEVNVIYTKFITNLTQKVATLSILPGKTAEEEFDELNYKYSFTNFEPSVEIVIANVATRLVDAQIWQATLESLASEHSMRMLAMKSATDNATQIIADLTLEFNTARQAGITQELAEISGGVEALNN
jgi:F-type H+-transporting ATPase subunit gamma